MRMYDPERAGANCRECPLFGATVVPPEGSSTAKLAIVGEGPGAQEEKRGRPFFGPSGVFLDDVLHRAGLKRADVFISNATLCRADTPGVAGKDRHDFKTYLAWIRKTNASMKKSAKAQGIDFVPMKTPLECCRPRLVKELMFLESNASGPNGLVVIPVGNFAAQAVIGMQGIAKIRGHVFSNIELEGSHNG